MRIGVEQAEFHQLAGKRTKPDEGDLLRIDAACFYFRDPIYRTPRELALTYFHEWFVNETGEKVLERYSKPMDVRRFGTDWLTTEEDLENVALALDALPYYYLVPKGNRRHIRKADHMELQAGSLIEWTHSDPRT